MVHDNVRIDPDHDLLPQDRIREVLQPRAHLFAQRPTDKVEARDIEVNTLGHAQVVAPVVPDHVDPTILESRAKGTNL